MHEAAAGAAQRGGPGKRSGCGRRRRITSACSLHVGQGHNGWRLLDWLGDVLGTDAVDVLPAPLGEAGGGLHAAFGDEDAEVRALEPVVSRTVHAQEEALVLVGQLVPVMRSPQKGQVPVWTELVGPGARGRQDRPAPAVGLLLARLRPA